MAFHVFMWQEQMERNTSVYLANTLSLSGKKLVCSLSHLCRVEERIRIDGRPIDSEQLEKQFMQSELCLNKVLFYNLPTLKLIFSSNDMLQRRNVQRAVIETGLGVD